MSKKMDALERQFQPKGVGQGRGVRCLGKKKKEKKEEQKVEEEEEEEEPEADEGQEVEEEGKKKRKRKEVSLACLAAQVHRLCARVACEPQLRQLHSALLLALEALQLW